MPTITWNEGSPSDSDSAGLGDDQIRSLKTSIRVGLDSEHIWPSSGGDAGMHRIGSARVNVGVQSLVSSSGTDGRLYQTSDTSRLFGTGSGGTTFLGGPGVISAGSFPGGAAPQRSIWVEEFGLGFTVSGSTSITIPNSGYSGAPYVFLTTLESNPTQEMCWVTTVSGTAFTVRSNATDNLATSSTTFFWRSIGSRTL